MCEQCAAATVEVGLVAPDLMLVRATHDGNIMKAGQYALVHADDPCVYLPDSPEPEPFSLDDESECEQRTDEDWRAYDAWVDRVDRLGEALRCHPMTGHALIESALAAGWVWENSGMVEFWLMKQCARLAAGQAVGPLT